MKLRMHTALPLAAIAGFALTANAAVVTVTGVSGHNGGNWPASLGHLSDMVNGNLSHDLGSADHNPGMDTSADPNDPSTWTYSGGTWQQEWLASSILDPVGDPGNGIPGSANGKIAWATLDLGSVTANLENMYLWNNKATNAGEYTDTYNVYYASSPTVAPPAMPNSQSNAGDYDFASGGWILLNGSPLTITQNTSNNKLPEGTVALGGIAAQYIGIEILTAGSSAVTRVGLAQVEITQIPEPSAFALLGLGGLALLHRRRK